MIASLGSAVMRGGSLVLADRRWTAPLCSIAVGFGLFGGIAIGPASDLSLAGGGEVIEVVESPAPAPPVAPPDTSGGQPAGGGGAPALTPSPAAPLAPAPSSSSNPGSGGGGGGAPGSDAPSIGGTVVHVNPVAGSYALASAGELYAIHASKLPTPAQRLRVFIRQLANGTQAQVGKPRRLGRADAASFRGVVTFVDPEVAGYTVSMPGTSMRVRMPEGSAVPPPPLGSFATVAVGIESPQAVPEPPPAVAPADPATSACARPAPPAAAVPRATLLQRSITIDGAPTAYADLAGTVQAVCPATGELVLSADDVREGGRDLTLTVPPSFDLARLAVDDPILGTAEIGTGGVLTLSGLASDRGIAGADDDSALQGDLQGG